MRILVVGSGGREHALAWKLAQSPQVSQVVVAPGNAGTAMESKVSNIAIDPLNFSKLTQYAKEQKIDFTVIGPEAPLAAGIVNYFQAENLLCLGPSAPVAQLEASKSFAKDFMRKHKIPTADYQYFVDLEAARSYIKMSRFPVVIKADGLAAGKGVVIAHHVEEALLALDSMLTLSGSRVVIEEFLSGVEVSYMVICDGQRSIALASSQDHKTLYDHNQGPNTGGMGAYSPMSMVDAVLAERIETMVIQPVLAALKAEQLPYTGFLYAGLMIDASGMPKVLEFNCRLGDPETQVLMRRLTSDFASLCELAVKGKLNEYSIAWDSRYALGVVMAASGYPGPYEKGAVIAGLETRFAEDVKIFHAGTQLVEDTVLTSGGRVLCVTAMGDTVAQAQKTAYAAVGSIHWSRCQYRSDIGSGAIKFDVI